MHLNGDFGTSGWPGTFKIFFVDVVLQMARFCQVLTLPLVCFVDGIGVIGSSCPEVDGEMKRLQVWCETGPAGVPFKVVKDRKASGNQLMIGFHWNSTTRTRTLEERKFISYVDMCVGYAGARTMSLQEIQSAAGKMHRACMTLPPGASCFFG